MKKTIFNGKSLVKALGIIALPMAFALTSCTEDQVIEPEVPSTPGAEQTEPVQQMNTATYTVGGGDQSRAAFTGYWGKTVSRSAEYNYNWPSVFDDFDSYFNVPADAKELTSDNIWNNEAGQGVFFLSSKLEVGEIQGNKTIYILNGGYLSCNANFTGNIYVCAGGTFESTSTNGTHEVYVQKGANFISNGDLKYTVYNQGSIEIVHSQWNNGVQIHSDAKVYSKDGESFTITVGDGEWDQALMEGTVICDGTVTVNGNLKVQTGSNTKDICSIVSNGKKKVEVVTDLTVGSIDAETITFDGASIYLHPNGYVHANKIVFVNSASTIQAYYESIGVVKCDEELEINLTNCPLEKTIGVGVYLETPAIYNTGQGGPDYIDMNTLVWTWGPNPNETKTIATASGTDHINAGVELKQPVCGSTAEPEPEPEPTPEPKPSLDQVANVESPTHDHDKDKSDPNRRHLSATSLTFDGAGNIYASYHMRGGNWGQDTYDKDDIEGCIERWTFSPENGVKIGNWMWTYEFDFNHIILDGNYVVTVGHKGGEKTVEGDNGQTYTDFGGIIGRLPISFNGENTDGETVTRSDFEYKYLTTDEPLYGYADNEKQGTTTWQKIDYKNAGDGNCVVRVGDKYYVATSAGYGIVNEDFSRYRTIEGTDTTIYFTRTPGSAKYLVENNGTVNVLYLNDRPKGASEATTSFGATMAKMSMSNFPFVVDPTDEWALPNNVSPVDGKNVIAVDGSDIYSCLSKGGLAKNGASFKTFGEERSVNGVAVDDRFIYVANGSYITVLDKAGNVVVERKGETEKVSANFVEVNKVNGEIYVFVAFGQEGIKVYHLNNV